jgi:hypothetical protein
MQYILTEAEYNALKAKQEIDVALSTKQLQKLCTKIANEMPVKFWGRKEATPWGCRITLQESDENSSEEWYCDECPVTSICPAPKYWSK